MKRPLVEHAIDAILRFRWSAIAITLVLALAAASGLPRLQFEGNYRHFFGDENPDLKAFDAFQAVYAKNDNIFFVLRDAEEDVFSPLVASAVEEITARAWTIPFATRVDSVTNYQHTAADGDTLIVGDLVRSAASLTDSEFEGRRAIALAEPSLVNNLISPDGRTTGINVTVQFPEKSMTEVPEAVAAARQIADDIRAEYPSIHIALTGIAAMNAGFIEAGEADARTLIPLMYLAMLLLTFASLRSISGTVSTLVVIALSTVSALGLAGYMGIKLAPITVAAPNIILTLAVADSIHVISGVRKGLMSGLDKISAIKRSLKMNMAPVFVTSVTTIIGFLSLNFSDAPPFRALGNITAMGIAAAWLFSVVLVPAFLSLMPLRAAQTPRAGILDRPLSWLADLVIARRNAVLAITGAASIGMIGLATTNELNDAFLEYFDHRLQIRHDLDFANENLKTPDLFEFSLESAGSGGINDPAYLRELERFTEYLRGRDDVMHVLSYADTVKRLNRNMHGDDPDWYRLPESSELAAQYLLLYELSLPYGLDLNDRINIDRSATRVTATLHKRTAAEQRQFIQETEDWLRNNTPEHMWTRATGVSVMVDYLSLRNAQGMIRGNAVAILLIAVTAMITFRSVGLGALSIIPNAVPALVTFGFWALVFGKIGMAASIILATSLGVVVDDTIHFLSKYLHGRRADGMSRPDAVRYAFQSVGDAIVKTSIILAVGFGVLAYSAFGVNSQLGLLTAIAILVALVFDLLALPAMLLIGHREPDPQPKGITADALQTT